MHTVLSASEKARAKLVSALVVQSPPGELLAVSNDVKTLLADDSLLDKCLESGLKTHNLEQLVTATLPEGHVGSVIVSAYNELPGGLFLDPVRSLAITFDHLKQVTRPPMAIRSVRTQLTHLNCDINRFMRLTCVLATGQHYK